MQSMPVRKLNEPFEHPMHAHCELCGRNPIRSEATGHSGIEFTLGRSGDTPAGAIGLQPHPYIRSFRRPRCKDTRNQIAPRFDMPQRIGLRARKNR